MSSVSPCTVSCPMRAFLYVSVMSASDSTMNPSWTFRCSCSSVNRAIPPPSMSLVGPPARVREANNVVSRQV
jgi:hypothetical protein